MHEQPAAQTSRIRSDADRAAAVRRQVRDELYQRLVLFSAATWTLGTFIVFAAGNPSPVPMAKLSMTLPLVPAALPWLLFRCATTWLVTRRLQASQEGGR